MLGAIQKLFGSKEPIPEKSEDVEQQEYIQYAMELEQALRMLEAGVHESDDPNEIIPSVMKCACEFYQGDWVGFLEVDLELALWTPTVWYNPNLDDKTTALLGEFESSEFLHRWVKAMQENTAIVIDNIDEVKRLYPEEYLVLERLYCETVLAVPVKPRPTGFLLVRNPKRYINRSSMLQLLAFVVLACVNERKLMQSMKLSFSPDRIEHDTDVIIHLFGNLEIYTSSGVLRESDLKSPMCCRLLAYMVVNKKVTIPAWELAQALWPEEAVDQENPSKNLRALIFRLRQSFSLISEYQLIETTPNGYRLNPKLNIMTDLQIFDRYWDTAQQMIATSSRVDVLKQAVDMYKGNVLASADAESWLMLTSNHYNLRYVGMVNELLKTLNEQKDYHNLQKYAAQSLAVEPGNVKAYYWLMASMCNMGATEMAKSQMEMAKQNLTDEEYYDLVSELKKADIEPSFEHFRNGKYSI